MLFQLYFLSLHLLMKIVLIGAGNLATNLGKALKQAGHDIVQVWSRTIESATSLSDLLNSSPVNEVDKISWEGDVYIFSVKDDALSDVIVRICRDRQDKIFLHTSGSMPIDCFDGNARHYGVLYPMQTFSKTREVDFSIIPCFIEANDEYALTRINILASSISANVIQMASEKRRYLHLSAVWSCNFVNHCYNVASTILEKENIPFDVMLPLIDETSRKVHQLLPSEAQTGPAIRYDENIIYKHIQLLKDMPALQNLYEKLSMSIHQYAMQERDNKQKTVLDDKL